MSHQKVLTDTFTRADNVATLGTTEPAGATELQAWAYSNGFPWGIIGNQAYRPAVMAWDSGTWGRIGPNMVARLYNFVAGTAAVADEVDAELDQLVTGVNDALPKAGGTMTGALVLPGPPTVALHAATKAYVDSVTTGWTSLRKPVDTSRASTVVLADDPHLLFAMAANTSYLVKMSLAVSATSINGFNWNCLAPAGATWQMEAAAMAPASANATLTWDYIQKYYWTEITTAAITQFNAGAATHDKTMDIQGIIKCGATAGDFALRWSQWSTSVTATILRAGSYLEHRIAV